jgi:hypothetical protein
MEIETGDDVYSIESSYSFPGKMIGYNHLTETDPVKDSYWKPEIKKANENTIKIIASCSLYSLNREVKMEGHRIKIFDTITNTGEEDVGVIVKNVLKAPRPAVEVRLCGVSWTTNHPDTVVLEESGIKELTGDSAENPTLFLSLKSSCLGAVAEDNVSRMQFEASCSSDSADFSLKHLCLRKGCSVTLEWALYPFAHDSDYWSFINLVRDDWKTNFRVKGSWCSINITERKFWEIFTDTEKLSTYIKRKKFQILALSPWIDYENYNFSTNKIVTREEYKEMAQAVKETVRKVDPAIKIIGCIEAPFVSLPRELVNKIYAALPAGKTKGYLEFTEKQTGTLKNHPEAWNRWKDSVVWTKDGRAKYELYTRGEMPFIALTVRPAKGNGQHKYLMDQAKFVIKDVGLDGIYIDSFTGAKHSHYGYTYDKWDGITVDINPITGKIIQKYTDLALAGTESRKLLIEYGLDKGGTVVINGHSVSRETQALGAFRFNESEWGIDPFSWNEGEKPPFNWQCCQAHLSTPVGLGYRPVFHQGDKGTENYAALIMKMIIDYLRNGILYYHYGTEIPETGPGSGEYGPINHMFPITPKRLGEGFVEGEERILTCVSRTFQWQKQRIPEIILFDIKGKTTQHDIKPIKNGGYWKIKIQLRNWQEIAVIEENNS